MDTFSLGKKWAQLVPNIWYNMMTIKIKVAI